MSWLQIHIDEQQQQQAAVHEQTHHGHNDIRDKVALTLSHSSSSSPPQMGEITVKSEAKNTSDLQCTFMLLQDTKNSDTPSCFVL